MMQRMPLASVFILLGLAGPALAADNKPVKVLIITGDHGHAWKRTTPFLKELLTKAGMEVAVTATPAGDLATDSVLKYDVFLLNYNDRKYGNADMRWSMG